MRVTSRMVRAASGHRYRSRGAPASQRRYKRVPLVTERQGSFAMPMQPAWHGLALHRDRGLSILGWPPRCRAIYARPDQEDPRPCHPDRDRRPSPSSASSTRDAASAMSRPSTASASCPGRLDPRAHRAVGRGQDHDGPHAHRRRWRRPRAASGCSARIPTDSAGRPGSASATCPSPSRCTRT